MSLDPSLSRIFCQRCATAWEITETVPYRKFVTTSTYSAQDYVSPSDIFLLDPSEEILYCPKCHDRELDRAFGDASSFLEPDDLRVNPDQKDSERPGSGDADVVHSPPSYRKT